MKQRFFGVMMVCMAVSAGFIFWTRPVLAGECFEFPAQTMNDVATVTSGVFVRSVACMDGSDVLATLFAGEVVSVTAVDDGWYQIVRSDGTTGWVWGDFLAIGDGVVTEQKDEVQQEDTKTESEPVTDTRSFTDRVKGHILLQVEEHGEAYYVHPDSGDRYYMADGPTAYEMMRAFGLGISNADLSSVPEVSDEAEMLASSSVCATNALAARLAGRILLQVDEHGEAYYVHPDTCRRIYMKDGDSAYQIMRELSLGITNADLNRITLKDFEAVPYETKTEDNSKQGEVAGVAQGGNVPDGVDLAALNTYWLNAVNELRAERGLRQLVIDDRFVGTGTEYAELMYENQWYAHERDGGLTMHQWIDTKGLDFTERYSEGGWQDNYFTENISWGISDGTMAGVEKVLDQSKNFFLGEVSWNGPHYRTIYHPDWNAVGLGFYFEPLSSGTYKVYVVMHYGSLQM